MISITETFEVAAPPEKVWRLLSEPEAVVSCISGAELGTRNPDQSYDGSLAVTFGALRVKFNGRVELDFDDEAMEGKIRARGKDAQGGTRLTATAIFAVRDEHEGKRSAIAFHGDVEIRGKLAQVVEAGGTTVTRRMVRDFADNVTSRCSPVDVVLPVGAVGVVGRKHRVEAVLRALWARFLGRFRRLLVRSRRRASRDHRLDATP